MISRKKPTILGPALLGLALCMIPASGAGPSDGKSPGKWLAEFRSQTETEPADPEFQRLWRGAAIYIHGDYRRGRLFGHELTSHQQELVDGFAGFLRARGQSLFEQWLGGRALSGVDRKYKYILNGLCFSQYFKTLRPKVALKMDLTPIEQRCLAYSRDVMRRGVAVLRNAYRTQLLDAGEIEQLRLYAMWADITSSIWAYTEGDYFLPYSLGFSRPFDWSFPDQGQGYQLQGNPNLERHEFHPGEAAPDFNLVRLDAALASPSYDDLNPFDPAVLLKPLVLEETLNAVAGYRVERDSAGREIAAPLPDPSGGRFPNDRVRLSSFRGRKPVVLVMADPTDAWMWNFHICGAVDALQKLYGDRVEFFFVHVNVHDGYMPMYDFFGPAPGKWIADHAVTLEERARTAKMLYLGFPYLSTPYLLDDMAQTTRNAYMCQGGEARIFLVDIDGKIVYDDNGDKVKSEHRYRLTRKITLRTSALEQEILALLANGGRLIPGHEMVSLSALPERRVEDAEIVAINRKDRLLKMRRRAPEQRRDVDPVRDFYTVTQHQEPDPRIYEVRLAPKTRIARKEGDSYRLLDFSDLRTGQRWTVSCRATETNRPEEPCAARHVYNHELRPMSRKRSKMDSIWFHGTVTEIVKQYQPVVVVMSKAMAGRSKGYGLWKDEAGRAIPVEPAKHSVPIVRQWVEGADADRTCRFAIDDAVELFLNGGAAEFSRLRVGDRVAAVYGNFQHGRRTIHPDLVRASR